jgi:YidC/Oxa1 family membrane protein insertase
MTPRQNFLQTMLLMIAIFLAMQLFFRPQPAPTVPAEELMRQMRVSNERLLDQTIVGQHGQYVRVIDQQEKDKKLTSADTIAKRVEAAVILADTQLKAGIDRNDTNRIRNAYHTLVPLDKQLSASAAWANPVTVANEKEDPRFGWDRWSAAELYQKTIATLSERHKHDLIWGFIPGGYAFIDFLVNLTGAQPAVSYAIAAFILALVVRAAVFPLAQKQYMFSRQMSQLTPLTTEIREKYKDDQATMNVKVMELYKEYGINPMAGCFPAFIQLPLFLTVYQCMLLYQFEFVKGTFLWVNPATSRATNGLTAPNLGQLDPILILIYGITMMLTTLLTPVSDPNQLKQQRLIGIGMSVFITVTMFFGWFPVPGAFVLYWIFLNILATIQGIRAYRLPLPPLTKVNTRTGGVYPTSPMGGKWAQRMEEMMRMAEEQQRNRNNGGSSNGSGNGKPAAKGTVITTEPVKTGTPAKHKPKKRK